MHTCSFEEDCNTRGMCLQGIMREPDFPLSKAVKNKDVMIKVNTMTVMFLLHL